MIWKYQPWPKWSLGVHLLFLGLQWMFVIEAEVYGARDGVDEASVKGEGVRGDTWSKKG